jgi:hypothetical protein
MTAFAEFKDPSHLLSFYGAVAYQLEEVANHVREQPPMDRMMAERLQGFADQIRDDIKSGWIFEGACRVLARHSGPDAES